MVKKCNQPARTAGVPRKVWVANLVWLTICDTCLDRLEREKRMRGGDLTDCVRKVQFLSSSPVLGLELCPLAEAEGAVLSDKWL